MLINTMEEESLSEGMVSQITVEYKMFGSDKMELMEGIGRAIRRIYYGVCGMLMKNPYFLTKLIFFWRIMSQAKIISMPIGSPEVSIITQNMI